MNPVLKRLLLFGIKKPLIKSSFNYADTVSGLGKAETGQTWLYEFAANGSRVAISGNAALSISADIEICYINAGKANVCITTIIKSITANARYPVIFRYGDTSNYWYIRASTGVYTLQKTVSSTVTVMASTLVAAAAGDVLKIRVKNDTIEFFVNGAFVVSVTDSALNANTKVGFGFFSNTTSQEIDDFKVEAI